MAESEVRKSYPTMPSTLWWKLRRKFQQSIPSVVTESYLATLLEMEIISARTNVLPSMKTLGLIDSEGKPLERVRLWRDDDHYPDVCKAIVAEIYPEELTEAIPDPAVDRPKVLRWFATKLGVGTNSAGKMAAMYAMLMEADVSKQDSERKAAPAKKANKQGTSQTKNLKIVPKPEVQVSSSEIGKEDGERHEKRSHARSGPDVNINLQIHISSDASPEQIEQIFESMSKHLYKNG